MYALLYENIKRVNLHRRKYMKAEVSITFLQFKRVGREELRQRREFKKPKWDLYLFTVVTIGTVCYIYYVPWLNTFVKVYLFEITRVVLSCSIARCAFSWILLGSYCIYIVGIKRNKMDMLARLVGLKLQLKKRGKKYWCNLTGSTREFGVTIVMGFCALDLDGRLIEARLAYIYQEYYLRLLIPLIIIYRTITSGVAIRHIMPSFLSLSTTRHTCLHHIFVGYMSKCVIRCSK